MKNKITLLSVVQCNTNILVSNIDNEVVMMSIENNQYYGLNNIGSRIWQLIQQPVGVEKIVDCLYNEYDVDKTECEKDVCDYLEQLISKNLITIL